MGYWINCIKCGKQICYTNFLGISNEYSLSQRICSDCKNKERRLIMKTYCSECGKETLISIICSKCGTCQYKFIKKEEYKQLKMGQVVSAVIHNLECICVVKENSQNICCLMDIKNNINYNIRERDTLGFTFDNIVIIANNIQEYFDNCVTKKYDRDISSISKKFIKTSEIKKDLKIGNIIKLDYDDLCICLSNQQMSWKEIKKFPSSHYTFEICELFSLKNNKKTILTSIGVYEFIAEKVSIHTNNDGSRNIVI